ncbi:MAG: ExbD/TolR family protein [Candidatus Babeliales bacterium]
MMRRYHQRKRQRNVIPEVSLTPLIDTALTLLIIFMVATPMLHNALKIDLPKGSSQEAGKEPQQLIISIDTAGKIFFNNNEVSLDTVGEAVKKHVAQKYNSEQSIWVHAHAKSSCDLLVGVIDRIKTIGGIKDVNIAMQKAIATRA